MARQMKDSGIEWLKDVPSSWIIKRNKGCFECSKEIIGSDSAKTQLLSLTTHGIKEKRPEDSTGKVPESYDTYQVVAPDDIVMCLFDLDVSAVFSGISPFHGMISPAYKVLKCKEGMLPDYANYWFSFVFDGRKFKHYSKNLRFTLTYDEFAILPIIVPPLGEQERIATFLDTQCAHINTVIEKTKASIEEYKKLKQAVITQAVTKGVRGDRPMKSSKSIWFGTIPSDWQMRKMKYIFRIKKVIAGEEGREVLSITQRGMVPKDLSKNEGQLASDYSGYQLVEPGDFAMNHMDLLTGWVDISKYSGVTSPDYRVFVLKDEQQHDKRYYLYLMQMCYFNRIFYGLGQGVSGMGRWRLQTEKFLNFYISVPPYDEQIEISDHLDEKCAKLDQLIAEKSDFLRELDSYKKSLIYECITGKKEVD